MTPENIEQLKQRLIQEEQSLVTQLRLVSAENPAVPGDFEPTMPFIGDSQEDVINESSELDREVALESTLEQRLEEVRAALTKIAANTYGLCDSCGSPIEEKRLQAIPTTTRCMHCAEK